MSNDLVSYVTSANSVIAILYRRYRDHGEQWGRCKMRNICSILSTNLTDRMDFRTDG